MTAIDMIAINIIAIDMIAIDMIVIDMIAIHTSDKGSSGLSQNNNFWEHSRRKQHNSKLGIWGGANVSGSFGFHPLQRNPL